MAHGSFRAVMAAIVGNSTVTVAKMVAFFITGSAAMLSEALHSMADTLNQILLMIGIRRSSRAADPRFPFGYGAERAVWALMSAVGIFFLGCGVTVYHGIQSLLHPHELEGLGWAVGVLVVSFVIEFAVLVLAVRTVRHDAKGKPFFAYLRHEADPTAVAVVLEDSAACLGVVIALVGIFASHWTGNSLWDAVASILIGLLLGMIATWLVARTRHQL
ncbi:MAG: cation diffusion facilitator family transporter, partial [Acidobacteriota bacterium]